MANRCAGLNPAWAHLPPAHAAGHCGSSTPPPPWLSFENEALTSALRASMSSPAAAANDSSSSPSHSSSTSDLPSCRRAAAGPGPKAGRVAKRKPRPSRRPPATYISADPANFRRMVQEVTGCSCFPAVRRHHQAAPTSWRPATPPPACALPTLDTSAFLLDRAAAAPAPGPDDNNNNNNKSSSGGGASSPPAMAAVTVEDDDSSVLQQLEAMARDFPTLESWGII